MDESNPTTPVMDELFFGDFNPEEQILSQRPEYREACRDFSAKLLDLKQTLPGEKYHRLEEALQDQAVAETYQNLEFFKYGLTVGIKIMQEVSEELTELELQ